MPWYLRGILMLSEKVSGEKSCEGFRDGYLSRWSDR